MGEGDPQDNVDTHTFYDKQYFGFTKNELLFKDPKDVYSRSARPSASCAF